MSRKKILVDTQRQIKADEINCSFCAHYNEYEDEAPCDKCWRDRPWFKDYFSPNDYIELKGEMELLAEKFYLTLQFDNRTSQMFEKLLQRYRDKGSSFECRLVHLYDCADTVNRKKLLATFPNFFKLHAGGKTD